MASQLNARNLDRFAEILATSKGKTVRKSGLWAAFAEAFPGRPQGKEEAQWFLDALTTLAERGVIRLPPVTGKRWEEILGVRAPVSIDLHRNSPEKTEPAWRTFPWHHRLSWVADLKRLTDPQQAFLMKVHQGLVEGWFLEPAPFKYRSLQLTGDEKGIGYQIKTALFGPGRLNLDLLGCMRETLPLAWEAVSDRPRAIVFENADPFAIARRVLGEMEDPPYGIVVYGGGYAFSSSVAYLATLDRQISEIHYVGDMDKTGLEIALAARDTASAAGLPKLKPATALHREMIRSAEALGKPGGWPASNRRSLAPPLLQTMAAYLGEKLFSVVIELVESGNRIPEEVLGMREMREGMRATQTAA